jgi:hypothetical protein
MRVLLPASVVGIVLLGGGACGKAQVTDIGPAAGAPGASPRPGTGNGADPAPGGSGGGFTLPEPAPAPATPAPAATPQCAAEAHTAEPVQLDLMILVDSSSSMTGAAGARSKWATAQAALSSFVADPKSAGLGVGLQFFPKESICTTDQDCVPGATSTNRYCTGKQICAGPGGPAPNASACGPPPFVIVEPRPVANCPMGTTCQALGFCSGNGENCTNLGQPCPMGAGDCQGYPRTCASVFGGCDETSYAMPTVPIQPLPAGLAFFNRVISRKTPDGGTPMGPAVRGVLNHLRARLAANPGHKVALILASDGLPSGCQRGDIASIAADLNAAFAGSPSIPTYVIGVFSQSELAMARPQLDSLAAGGGTGQAFVLTASDDLNARLLEALEQIRGFAVACDYRIPAPAVGSLDYGKVNVRFSGAAGPENVPYVESIDRCDPVRGGWYYDVHPAAGKPGRVLMCPATCSRFKAERSVQVDLVFGCATQNID